jgi:hypothetical protein
MDGARGKACNILEKILKEILRVKTVGRIILKAF